MNRVKASALAFSASALVALALHEGYSDTPIIPVAGDVLTIGFGDTRDVKKEDKTTPIRALVRLSENISKDEQKLKACIGDVPLYQYEWDAYVSWTYNVGTGADCRSTLVKKLKQQPPDYEGACKELLRWDKFNGKPLRGLTVRREKEYKQCIGQ
jgi:lysozyme